MRWFFFVYICCIHLFAEGPLVFYHIPKTAGTHLDQLLRAKFPPKKTLHAFYYQIEQLSWENICSYDYLQGHFFFSSQLSQIPHARNITFLRDPVERVLSAQRYFLSSFQHDPNTLYKNFCLPPGPPIETIANQACLFLSSFSRSDPTVTIEMHLESAKQNLRDRFFFIGFVDDMEGSIRSLFTLLGWGVPDAISKINVSRIQSFPVSEATLQKIREKNWADIELYRFAKTL